MERHDYVSGPTAGGKFGCIASAVTAVLFSVFVLAPLSMGDCLPNEECQKRDATFWLAVTAILLISGAAGIVVRQLVNRFTSR